MLNTRLNGNMFKVNSERKSEKQRNSTPQKIKFHFQTGSTCDAWKGLKTIAGHSKPKLNNSSKPGHKQKELSDELKDFYCRYDTQDFRTTGRGGG